MVCVFRAFLVNQYTIESITDNACLFRISLKYLIIYFMCFTFGCFTCVTNWDCTSLCILGWGMFSLCPGTLKYSIMSTYYFRKGKQLESTCCL